MNHPCPSGADTMSEGLAELHHYYDWIFSKFRPYLGRRILEIGPGFGSLAERLMKSGYDYAAIDQNEEIIDRLCASRTLPDNRGIVGDVTSPSLLSVWETFKPDTLISMNVLEHIQDDTNHLRSLSKIFPGARLLLFVPAHPFLYSRMDQEAGHFRRYTKAGLRQLLKECGLMVDRLVYMNAVGTLTWLISARLFNCPLQGASTRRQMILFDRLILPWAKHLDYLFSSCTGQSLFAAARFSESS